MGDELIVRLSGYNVDADLLSQVMQGILDLKSESTREEGIERLAAIDPQQFTPETISAAYARISRDQRDATELRAHALESVAKARSSNEQIIFEMGHKSVGQHTNFNFDIIGLSRLAVEALQRRRVGCGYTEKSQRYVKLDGDFVVPQEFVGEDVDRFKALMAKQVGFYETHLDRLKEHHYEVEREKAGKVRKSERRRLKGYAKEDARYALGLCTTLQVGTTFNATALEHAVRTMRHSDLAEERDLASKLEAEVMKVAPSLMKCINEEVFKANFPKADFRDDYYRDLPGALQRVVDDTWRMVEEEFDDHRDFRDLGRFLKMSETKGRVSLLKCDNVDTNVIAALLHSRSYKSAWDCYLAATYIGQDESIFRGFMEKVLRHVTLHDNPPREFEFTDALKFEIISNSSVFAHLKRHRMNTLLEQRYDPELGITVPPSIDAVGLSQELYDLADESADLFFEFEKRYDRAAEYCLINAHRRRVLMSMCPRQLNAFARLRSDDHAQWDVRQISKDMVELAKRIVPLALLTACGKSEFKELYGSVYAE